MGLGSWGGACTNNYFSIIFQLKKRKKLLKQLYIFFRILQPIGTRECGRMENIGERASTFGKMVKSWKELLRMALGSAMLFTHIR